MADETAKTSLKGIFQDIAGHGIPDVLQGVVQSVSPLKIQVINDEKLIVNQNIAIVPQHLTDYQTEVTVSWEYETGRKKIIVHNALKVGDKVHLLSFKGGKQSFVLGRVAS